MRSVCAKHKEVLRAVTFGRSWLGHLLALMMCLSALPAAAVPMYQYTYTSNTFDFAAADPYTPDSFITLQILSPTRLGPGAADLASHPGISFSANDTWQTLHYPDSLPFTEFRASLYIDSVDAAGLPTAWEALVGYTYFEPFEWQRWGLISTINRTGNVIDVGSFGSAPGGSIAGFSIDNPGVWQLAMVEVPELDSLLLFGLGLIGLAGMRATRQAVLC